MANYILGPKEFVINQGTIGTSPSETTVSFKNDGEEIIMTVAFRFKPVGINLSDEPVEIDEEKLAPSPVDVVLPTEAVQNIIPKELLHIYSDLKILLDGRTASIYADDKLLFVSGGVKGPSGN